MTAPQKIDPNDAAAKQSVAVDLSVLDDYVQYLQTLQSGADHAAAADARRVIDCLRFIKLNQGFIRYVYDNPQDGTIYRDAQDRAQNILRDCNGTAFSMISRLSTQKNIDYLNALVTTMEEAITVFTERNRLLVFTQQFSYLLKEGSLEDRIKHAFSSLDNPQQHHAREYRPLKLIKHERATVKMISSNFKQTEPEAWAFITQQLADPNHVRPVSKREPKSVLERQIYTNPRTQEKTTNRAVKEQAQRGMPKKPGDPGYNYIKKTAMSLLPQNGKMALFDFENPQALGLMFDIDRCYLKNEKYMWPGNIASDYRPWLGHHGCPKGMSLQDLREDLRKHARLSLGPRHNEIMICPSRQALRAIVYTNDSIETRLNALRFQRYIQTKFSINLPIVKILMNQKPRIYDLTQQQADLQLGIRDRGKNIFGDALSAINKHISFEGMLAQVEQQIQKKAAQPAIKDLMQNCGQETEEQILQCLAEGNLGGFLNQRQKNRLLRVANQKQFKQLSHEILDEQGIALKEKLDNLLNRPLKELAEENANLVMFKDAMENNHWAEMSRLFGVGFNLISCVRDMNFLVEDWSNWGDEDLRNTTKYNSGLYVLNQLFVNVSSNDRVWHQMTSQRKHCRDEAFVFLTQNINRHDTVGTLKKLLWAREQPMFSAHRSSHRLATIGRTNTVVKIDSLIDQSFQQLRREMAVWLKSYKTSDPNESFVDSFQRCQQLLIQESYFVKAKQVRVSLFARNQSSQYKTFFEVQREIKQITLDKTEPIPQQALQRILDALGRLKDLSILDKQSKEMFRKTWQACEGLLVPDSGATLQSVGF